MSTLAPLAALGATLIGLGAWLYGQNRGIESALNAAHQAVTAANTRAAELQAAKDDVDIVRALAENDRRRTDTDRRAAERVVRLLTPPAPFLMDRDPITCAATHARVCLYVLANRHHLNPADLHHYADRHAANWIAQYLTEHPDTLTSTDGIAGLLAAAYTTPALIEAQP